MSDTDTSVRENISFSNVDKQDIQSAVKSMQSEKMEPVSFAEVHAAEREFLGMVGTPESALCLSGGGIRSATFALGLLQGLAKKGLLQQMDYLSTVSGGGYIGGWLTALRLNQEGQARETREGWIEALKNPTSEPVRHLRQYSNYLSPRLGLFSADTWTLAAIFLRNLLLNFLILIPFLLAGVLSVLGYVALHPVVLVLPDAALWAMAAVAAALVIYAVARASAWLPILDPQRNALTESKFVLHHITPLTLAAALMCLIWYRAGDQVTLGVSFAAAAGLGIAVQVVAWFIGGFWVQKRPNLFGWAMVAAFGAGSGLMFRALALGPIATWLLDDPVRYVIFAVPIVLCTGALTEFLFSGAASFNETIGDQDREWLARAAAWTFIFAGAWVVGAALVLASPWLLYVLRDLVGAAATAAAGVTAGGAATYLGWSSLTQPLAQKSPVTQQRWVAKAASQLAEKLLAPFFIVCIVGALSLAASTVLNGEGVPPAFDKYWWSLTRLDFREALLFALLALGTGLGLGYLFSVNRFSLNAMYRNRLIRAYLGASRKRESNRLTGFDEKDNLTLDQIGKADRTLQEKAARRPFHILNLALNVTNGSELAWQQRMARSFTVSPLYSGWGGYHDDRAYQESKYFTDAGGISLGMAIAVSGAAASPNMGYHSSKLLTMLMALFNARLGAWLPNTKANHVPTLTSGGPASPLVLLQEMFGLTGDKERWVYLSDGGHFENLGLYEMVRRRVPLILVSDASADPHYRYEDLSNALQKIRVDLGVESEFVARPELHNRLDTPGHHFAVLRLSYPALTVKRGDQTFEYPEASGTILYLKPALSGVERTESPDVYKYAAENKEFPHQSTGDQFFDEAQFESYRRLGEQSAEQIFGAELELPAEPKLEAVFGALRSRAAAVGRKSQKREPEAPDALVG